MKRTIQLTAWVLIICLIVFTLCGCSSTSNSSVETEGYVSEPEVSVAEETNETKDPGGDITWTLDDEGTLTISGSGNMKDYTLYYDDPPWHGSIQKVVIEPGVTSIGDVAFYSCSNLTEITIPDTVIRIGDRAFQRTRLVSITLPNGLTSIGDNAFHWCYYLENITLSDSLTSIGTETFEYCTSLENIEIPENVVSIGELAFNGCSGLKSVIFPDSLTSIGAEAFEDCTSLESVTIPENVTNIGKHAFNGCSGLKSVIFLGDAPEMGKNFWGSDLKMTVYYPADNDTWTEDIMLNYYGITWEAYSGENPEETDSGESIFQTANQAEN